MRKTFAYVYGLLLLLLLPAQSWAGDPEVLARLKALPGVSDVKELESDNYDNKYLLNVEQEVDPINHQAGKFKQRVVVCHVGYDRPTVLVTEGYSCNYTLGKKYQEELSKLLNANLVIVEYRYFADSTPQPCDWQYLTVANSLYDLHHVNQLLHRLYNRKWIATGISKGGQTCIMYRAWFPNDVDLSVPYVAPLCDKMEETTQIDFIEHQVSKPQARQKVKDYQTEVLKRRDTLLPLFKQYVEKKKYTFRVSLNEIFDLSVLEYAYAFWQWGTPVSKIPASSAPDSVLFKHLMAVSEPGYFAEHSPNLTFFVQAVRELGYYAYDVKPFKKLLSIKTTHDYLHRVMLPETFKDDKFSKDTYRRTLKFLKQNDPKMIFIYGGIDPWGSVGVHHQGKWLQHKQNIRVFVWPEGSHSTRISSFPDTQRKEIMDLIHKAIDD